MIHVGDTVEFIVEYKTISGIPNPPCAPVGYRTEVLEVVDDVTSHTMTTEGGRP